MGRREGGRERDKSKVATQKKEGKVRGVRKLSVLRKGKEGKGRE